MSKEKPAPKDTLETNTLLEQFLLPQRRARLDSVLEQRSASLTLVLDGVQNFHNISAVIRSADAFGLMDIHLVGSAHQYSKGITLGSERWMRIHSYPEADLARTRIEQEGFTPVVLQPESHCVSNDEIPSMSVSELPFERKLALIFGSERDGVSTTLLEAAKMQAYIPMRGFVESLNISVACAITLFCSTIGASPPRQRTAPLDKNEAQDIRTKWLMNSLRHPETVLKHISKKQEQEIE